MLESGKFPSGAILALIVSGAAVLIGSTAFLIVTGEPDSRPADARRNPGQRVSNDRDRVGASDAPFASENNPLPQNLSEDAALESIEAIVSRAEQTPMEKVEALKPYLRSEYETCRIAATAYLLEFLPLEYRGSEVPAILLDSSHSEDVLTLFLADMLSGDAEPARATLAEIARIPAHPLQAYAREQMGLVAPPPAHAEGSSAASP